MKKQRSNKNPWLTALKVVAWVVGVLIVVAAAVFWGFSIYLSPANITRLIEEKSSEYLRADIKIGKLDYRLWRSYPWLEFSLDSLTVVSHSLDGVPAEEQKKLPHFADSLASVVKLEGKVNLHALFKDEIELRDIYLERPRVNIVMVNDTTTNFNIAKEKMPSKIKMPKLDLSEIKVEAPVDFTFFSLQDDVDASVEVDNFYLTKVDNKFYKIGFDGKADGHYQNFALKKNIPIKFTTQIAPSFPNLEVVLSNLSISYAGLVIELDGEVIANQKEVDIKDLKLNVAINDLFEMLQLLPEALADKITIPDGISGMLPINISSRLLSPYHFDAEKMKDFSLENLPRFAALVNISDATLNLYPKGGKKVEADDIYLVMECNYDPLDSESTYLSVAELRMKGEGIALEGMARLSNLTGQQQHFEGKMEFQTPLMESLAYFLPHSPVKVAGFLKGDVNFSGDALEFGKKGASDIAISGDLMSHSLKLNSGKTGNVRLKNMKSDFRANIPDYPLTDYTGTKFGFDFSSDTVAADMPGTNITFGQLMVKLDASDTVSGSPDPFGTLIVKSKKMVANSAGNRIVTENMWLQASGSLNSSSSTGYPTVETSLTGDDALIESRVDHTPLFLEYEGGGIIQTVMGMVNLDATMKIEKGQFKTPFYLYPISFSGIDLSTNLNDLQLNAGNIRIADSGLSITTALSGLKPFMTSYNVVPLKIRGNLDFSNVDINELAWGYYGTLIAKGESYDSVFYAPPVTPFTSADSVCVVIPRNIDAQISLKSDAAQYMQYNFAPLSTDIVVKDGNATLSKLTVGAPYCKAIVDWTYSTGRLDNIFMDLKAKVDNFKFANFYPVFPQLTARAAEMKDFTGVVNADITTRFNMFPSMFMNPQSLAGRFDIRASDLKFARQGKIERITHLMLIEGDEPISIQNINISGSFHDDLLQVQPFKIKFDDYQLSFGGVNNLAGDMYYHLALEKSPFHLPFGVTIKGKLKHPEVRMGGTHIDNYAAEAVAANLTSNMNVNIMAYLHHGWLLFVQEAAKYEAKLDKKAP